MPEPGPVAAGVKRCKSGLKNYLHDGPLGVVDYYWAQVITNWCYKNGKIVSRQSFPSAGVTTEGSIFGLGVSSQFWSSSGCSASKSTCYTNRQVSFGGAKLVTFYTYCIQTRIWADGGHHRNIKEGGC